MSKNKKAPTDPTEKARRAALAELRERSARLDAQEAKGKASRLAGGKQDHEVPTAKEVANSADKPQPVKAKAAKAPKPAKEKKPKKVSGLDAAAMVLASAKAPMNMKQVFAEIQTKGLWKTNGQTPESTLYAAVIREIAAKGKESRFKKHDRGLFTAGKGV